MGVLTFIDEGRALDAGDNPRETEDRDGDRYPVLVGSRLKVGARLHPFAVTNLSTDGFRGECDCGLTPGTAIAVELPVLGFVRGQVRWTDDNTIGASFETALTLDDCRHALMPRPERRAGANDAWLRAPRPRFAEKRGPAA